MRKTQILEKINSLNNLPKLFKVIWQVSPKLTIINICLRLILSTIPVATLYIAKLIIDSIVQKSLEPEIILDEEIWQLIAIEFFLVVLADALSRLANLINSLLVDLFTNKTSIDLMKHAAILDLEQFEDPNFYNKLERARQQTVSRSLLLSQTLLQIQDIFSFSFLAIGLLSFNMWLLLLIIIAVFPAFFSEFYFNDKNYSLAWKQTPEVRKLEYIRYLGASDQTVKEVKIFNLSNFLITLFKRLSNAIYLENKRLNIKKTIWTATFAVLGSLGYYSAYVYIIIKAMAGSITIGELTFLAGSFKQLKILMENILYRFTAISQAAVYLSDFFSFFDMKPRIVATSNSKQFPNPIQQGFIFENVGYKYFNSDKWAIRNISFTLKVGEKIALVGENGAGKSTIIKLLTRLYEPIEGKILLDGHDLKEYDLNETRKNFSVIFQDFVRYQMKVSDNIAVGEISNKENLVQIIKAAELSLADQFIRNLPNNYEQVLGRQFNQGVDLSGGEWQRLAIARAFMLDTQLMVFDEPTAALDARAEYEVFKRFTDHSNGKTAIIISHRFSTVRIADKILVLENGNLTEIGSHDELLKLNGKYAELYILQAKGYK